MFTQLEVAAISFEPTKYCLAKNANQLEKMYRKAAANGAQLALAPEGILEGYVVMDVIEKRVPAEQMREVAISLRGSIIKRFRFLAKELKICLAFGLAESVGQNIYNSAIFIDQTGKICGKYNKMQLAEGYHPSWWFNRLGEKSRAFPTPFGRSGFLICNDRWNPDIARIPVLDGAQYLLIPSYGSRSKDQDNTVIARARENGVPIVEANVGVTLIISKGEVVACSRKKTAITHASIEIPARPSTTNRNHQENRFLVARNKEMRKRYRKTKERNKS